MNPFKVIIFDLDETLVWHNEEGIASVYTEANEILDSFSETNTPVYCVTWNRKPIDTMDDVGITWHFRAIYSCRGEKKSKFILDIMSLHPEFKPHQFLFVDDKFSHLRDCINHCPGVSICAASKQHGITWEDLAVVSNMALSSSESDEA